MAHQSRRNGILQERKKVECEAFLGYDRSRRYLDLAGVMIVAIDRKGRVTLINRKGCELLGFPQKDVIGKDWFGNFIPAHERSKVRSVFRRIVSGRLRMAERFENAVLTRSGKERLISWHNTLIKDKQGRFVSTLSSGEDITDLRKVENSLKESEEKFRRMVESDPDMVMLTDPDGTISYLSPACRKVIGWDPKDLVGRKATVTYPEDRKMVFAALSSALRGKSGYDLQYRILTKDGRVKWVSHTWSPIMVEGRFARVVSVVRDITEHKEDEDRLKESEERYRLLVEMSPDAVVVHDGKKVLFANPAAVSLIGAKKASDLVGRDVMSLVHPDYRVKVRGRIKTQRRGHGVPLMEERFLRIDGTPIDVGVSASPIFYGGMKAMMVVFRDISEQKRYEDGLRLQKEKVEEMSIMRERFLADIAHELKTPLSVIMLNLAMMKKMQSKPLCDLAPVNALLWRNVKRISTSIDQIMQFTARDSITVRKRDFDVADMMRGILNDYAPLARSKGLSFQFKGKKLRIESDPRLLSAAVSNLVSNAIKFTSEGRVRVLWGASGPDLVISVSDTGSGISPQNRGNIFEMFYKENHDAPGSGIGLSLSAEFVRRMGGKMTFRSELGEGSTFTITIPRR
ncbi:MAG: PAS domain-containing sensor histidine kinase [Candidatus Micrarchaeota archaeon]